MKVTFLQHHGSFGPGRLGEYLARKRHAITTVLMADQTREGAGELDADLVVTLPSSVSAHRTDVPWVAREHRILSNLIMRGTPLIGICGGAQMISLVTGGGVSDIGRSYVGWLENDTVVAPVWKGPWFNLHQEQCHLPASAEVLAHAHGTIQAFQCGCAIGLQFHPEIDADIVEAALPMIQTDFRVTAAQARGLVDETRLAVDKTAAAREALFDEILRRCFMGTTRGSARKLRAQR